MTSTAPIDWDFVDSHPMADQPDDDSPELTEADFARMRPAAEVLPQIMGAELAAEMLGTPTSGKQRITIMLDEAVVKAYKAKAGGRGYQTLINDNDTLRRALDADSVKEALREVIREELRSD